MGDRNDSQHQTQPTVQNPDSISSNTSDTTRPKDYKNATPATARNSSTNIEHLGPPASYAWRFSLTQATCVYQHGFSVPVEVLTAKLDGNLYQVEDVRQCVHALPLRLAEADTTPAPVLPHLGSYQQTERKWERADPRQNHPVPFREWPREWFNQRPAANAMP